MKVENLSIPEILLITPQRFGDARGWFSETFRQAALEEAGFVGGPFIQDNHALSLGRGVLRGLHFQRSPHAQNKLVRCIRGAIFDVAVDIRQGSPTFGQWVGAELSADNGRQMLVPEGFAHGYCTLSDDCEVTYKVTAYYAPQVEGGLRWNDPALAIDWTVPTCEITINARDAAAPLLAALDTPFVYRDAASASRT